MLLLIDSAQDCYLLAFVLQIQFIPGAPAPEAI